MWFFNITKIFFTPFFQKVKFGTIFVVFYFYLAIDEENTGSKVILCINQKTRNVKELVCKFTSTKVKRKGCLNHTEKLNKMWMNGGYFLWRDFLVRCWLRRRVAIA